MCKVQHGTAPDMNDIFREKCHIALETPLALKQGVAKFFIMDRKQLHI